MLQVVYINLFFAKTLRPIGPIVLCMGNINDNVFLRWNGNLYVNYPNYLGKCTGNFYYCGRDMFFILGGESVVPIWKETDVVYLHKAFWLFEK